MESINMEINYSEIIKRRRWSFIIPCLAVIIIALGFSIYLPSVYISTAKILVQTPEISSYYVNQSVTGYAIDRVGAIKEKVFNSDSILELVRSEGVYPSYTGELSDQQLVEIVRQNSKVENITGETEFIADNTTVFALSYEDHDPSVAQKYANYFSKQFLEENSKLRKKQASNVTDFLEKEVNKLDNELKEIEGKIGGFKEQYINELPSLLPENMRRLQEITTNREDLQEKLLNQQDLQRDLRISLASIPENKDELTEQSKLTQLENKLVDLKGQYSAEYPDVILAKAELEEFRKKLSSNPSGSQGSKKLLDNPAHLTLSSQLITLTNDIKSLQRQIEELQIKENEFQARIETTLRIEDDYTYLLSTRSNTQKKYDELMKKLMDARVSEGLEQDEKGEKFTLIQQPNFPLKPYKPNRVAIAILGCFLGVGFGTGLVVLLEYVDHSVRSVERLESFALGPVIGFVPYLCTDKNINSKMMLRLIAVLLILCVVVTGSFFIYKHNYSGISDFVFKFAGIVK